MTEECVSRLPERARVFDVDIDYGALSECRRDGRAIGDIAQGQSTIIYRPLSNKRPYLPSFCACAMGERPFRDIVGEFAVAEADIDGIPAEKVAIFGLMQLRERGFLGLSTEPARTQISNSHEGIDVALAAQIGGTQKRWSPSRRLQTQQPLSRRSDLAHVS